MCIYFTKIVIAGPLMCSCMGYGYVVKGAGLFWCLIIVLKITR